MTTNQLNNAILEILLNIGNSFDLEEVINSALSTYLQQLDCAGIILFERIDSKYNLDTAKPKILKNDLNILKVLELALYNMENDRKKYFELDTEYIIQEQDVTYYFCNLTGFGLLMFIKNGNPFNEITFKGLRAVHKKFANALISCKNIETIRLKDKLLSQQSKMASMGEMLENIAHQWRQPLSVVLTAATGIILEKELDILTNDRFIKSLNLIVDNSKYLSTTIDDFRNFFHTNKIKEIFLVNDIIKRTLCLIEFSYRNSSIHITKKLDIELRVRSLPNELMQALINLLNNSKDALKLSKRDKKIIQISLHEEDANAIITIHDNAGGIDEDIINKIFEPYFTTKHQSIGTGIGLYMTYQIIVNNMNGNIEVENSILEVDGSSYIGAKFTVTLPLYK